MDILEYLEKVSYEEVSKNKNSVGEISNPEKEDDFLKNHEIGNEIESNAPNSPVWLEKNDYLNNLFEFRSTSSDKVIPLERLIWAKNNFMNKLKGNKAYFPARRCNIEEGVTERYLRWPIKDDEVLIEFLCVPVGCLYGGRLQIVNMTEIYPFYEMGNRTKSNKNTANNRDKWNSHSIENMRNLFKFKYSNKTAEALTFRIMQVADQFLSESLKLASVLKTFPLKKNTLLLFYYYELPLCIKKNKIKSP